MQSLPSFTVLSVAAALGQIRGAATPSSASVVDDAIAALAEGDTAPALAVLCRASLGLKDGPLREVIVEAFDALPGLDSEFASCSFDNEQADSEGWALFNDGEIQRVDEAGLFGSDEAAVDHVLRMAQGGSAYHARALALHFGALAQSDLTSA